jgi:Flp pilus assembly protein TadB
MLKRFDEIARRKEILIERCAQERQELAAAFHQIHRPLNLGAVLMTAGKLLRAYPLAAGLSTLFVTAYGVKLTRVAGKVFETARIIRPVWSWWSKRRRAK